MSKGDLTKVVKNITKQIEANSSLRETLNTFKHEYEADTNSLEQEAIYQLEDLINTIGNPSSVEISRRKSVLKGLVDNYVLELYKAFKKYNGQTKITFRKGSSTSSFKVLAVGGLKSSGNGTKIDVFGTINSIRTRKLLPDLRKSILDEIFTGSVSEDVDKALYGNYQKDKTTGEIKTNKAGEAIRSGGLFQLGHEKQGSVSVRRKAEILKSLSKSGARQILQGTTFSKEIKAELVLAVNTYASREAGNLLKQFTTTLKLTEESAERNQKDASKERAFLNALKEEVKKVLLDQNLFTKRSSSNSVEIVNSLLEQASVKAGATVKKRTKAKSSKASVTGAIKGVTNKATSKESLSRSKATVSDERESSTTTNWASLISLINKRLPEVVARNMGTPGLVFRTGRLANSAKVVNIETTKDGYPSAVFSYQRTPYDVFDRVKGAQPWNTPARDPKALVNKSVREIMQEMAIGRFYTRRA
jgi:hypothetical protein